MVKFYITLSKTINDKDADLNAYELSEEEPTTEMKTKASETATDVVEELKDHKADQEAAIKEINDSA